MGRLAMPLLMLAVVALGFLFTTVAAAQEIPGTPASPADRCQNPEFVTDCLTFCDTCTSCRACCGHFSGIQGFLCWCKCFLFMACEGSPPAECGSSVGGVAELPGVSGSSEPPYSALASGLATALLTLTAGAWYARRRWLK